MGEVRQAKKAATRRALARATAALARDRGADVVSIAEITTAVGVSQRVRDCVAFLGAAVQWEAERVVARGGMTVRHEGFYGVPYEGGVVWVPAKWVAQVVGRVSMGHQRSFALGG